MKIINFILHDKLVKVELTDEIYVDEVFTKKDGFKIAKISTEGKSPRAVYYHWTGSKKSVDHITLCCVNFFKENRSSDCPMSKNDEGIFSAGLRVKMFLVNKSYEDIDYLILVS